MTQIMEMESGKTNGMEWCGQRLYSQLQPSCARMREQSASNCKFTLNIWTIPVSPGRGYSSIWMYQHVHSNMSQTYEGYWLSKIRSTCIHIKNEEQTWSRLLYLL